MPIPIGPVTTNLTFYKAPEDGSQPFNYVEPTADQPQRNYSDAIHEVTITDLRDQTTPPTLDHDGFTLLNSIPTKTTYSTFDTDETVRSTYYPEVESLLLQTLPEAHKVIIFDHTIRRADPSAARHPVQLVHADQTRWSAAQRVRRHIPDPEEAEKLLQGRYRIINVWRPINGKVESFPLAFASAATMRDEDFVKIEHRYPTFSGEIMGVRHNEGAGWRYCSGLDDHERVLIKCSDSKEGVAERVAHSAFVDPRSAADAKGRESIEVRTIVFG
ncbi:hypothetical protein BDV25DRAFT_125851 [Aspergillus avenaceus]|uniref:Methyltransferase n=1 Tax=Aspergillus avenaceus TaxID=36643 RepID=A0A5N6TT10_ASPAV|nr:hypothetical protein BDV25DRAFT_125851 [Aspergillus avenaceus]